MPTSVPPWPPAPRRSAVQLGVSASACPSSGVGSNAVRARSVAEVVCRPISRAHQGARDRRKWPDTPRCRPVIVRRNAGPEPARASTTTWLQLRRARQRPHGSACPDDMAPTSASTRSGIVGCPRQRGAPRGAVAEQECSAVTWKPGGCPVSDATRCADRGLQSSCATSHSLGATCSGSGLAWLDVRCQPACFCLVAASLLF